MPVLLKNKCSDSANDNMQEKKHHLKGGVFFCMRTCTFFGRKLADMVKMPIIVGEQAGINKAVANVSTVYN